jgi:hypothetical protein
MVPLSAVTSKTYKKELVAEVPEIGCPDPACSNRLLRGHGWYRRHLHGDLVCFRRARCPECGVTHALVPEDVCAYQDLTLPALESALEAAGPTPAARAVGKFSAAAVRRARRWFRSSTCTVLRDVLIAPGGLWERLAGLVGEIPGRLVGLRRWLWSEWRLLLGGPCGLFVYGRPRLCLHLNIPWQLLNGLFLGNAS